MERAWAGQEPSAGKVASLSWGFWKLTLLATWLELTTPRCQTLEPQEAGWNAGATLIPTPIYTDGETEAQRGDATVRYD